MFDNYKKSMTWFQKLKKNRRVILSNLENTPSFSEKASCRSNA